MPVNAALCGLCAIKAFNAKIKEELIESANGIFLNSFFGDGVVALEIE